MAYMRRMNRTGRRRRYRRKSRYTRRPRTGRHMTSGRVKRIIDAELKFHDTHLFQIFIPSTTGTIVTLSGIDVGDSPTERIGNWIKPVALHGTVSVEGNTAAAEIYQQFRIFIVQWRENQDVDVITLPKLVQNVLEPFQQYNVQSKGAFKVLWSWVGNVIAHNQNSQLVKTRHFSVRPRTKILYDDILLRKYQLFLVGFSNVASANDPPVFSINTRLRYTDS